MQSFQTFVTGYTFCFFMEQNEEGLREDAIHLCHSREEQPARRMLGVSRDVLVMSNRRETSCFLKKKISRLCVLRNDKRIKIPLSLPLKNRDRTLNFFSRMRPGMRDCVAEVIPAAKSGACLGRPE